MKDVNPQTPFGHTVFCDEIRQEINGKLFYIGVYSGEMRVFGTLPMAVNQLHLAVTYYDSPGAQNEPLELRVYFPGVDDDDAPSHVLPIAPPSEISTPPADLPANGLMVMHLRVTLSPLPIAKYGQVRVRMKKGDDLIRLGVLRVSEWPAEEAAAAGVVMQTVPLTEVEPQAN